MTSKILHDLDDSLSNGYFYNRFSALWLKHSSNSNIPTHSFETWEQCRTKHPSWTYTCRVTDTTSKRVLWVTDFHVICKPTDQIIYIFIQIILLITEVPALILMEYHWSQISIQRNTLHYYPLLSMTKQILYLIYQLIVGPIWLGLLDQPAMRDFVKCFTKIYGNNEAKPYPHQSSSSLSQITLSNLWDRTYPHKSMLAFCNKSVLYQMHVNPCPYQSSPIISLLLM